MVRTLTAFAISPIFSENKKREQALFSRIGEDARASHSLSHQKNKPYGFFGEDAHAARSLSHQ